MDGIRGAGPAIVGAPDAGPTFRPAGPSCRRGSLVPSGVRGARPASRPERLAVQCPRTREFGHATGERGYRLRYSTPPQCAPGMPGGEFGTAEVLNSARARARSCDRGVRYRRGTQIPRTCAVGMPRGGLGTAAAPGSPSVRARACDRGTRGTATVFTIAYRDRGSRPTRDFEEPEDGTPVEGNASGDSSRSRRSTGTIVAPRARRSAAPSRSRRQPS